MDSFNFKEYLTEGWLFKEVKTKKSDYLNDLFEKLYDELEFYLDSNDEQYDGDGGKLLYQVFERLSKKGKFTYNLEQDKTLVKAELQKRGYLKEEDNFNDEKYPKAEAWLEEHPNIKYFNGVPEQFLQYDIDKEDDPDSENIETAVTEAGYMFISELEAALEGGKDDEYLESCAMNGVINDPTYNPPIDSWDYRIR